MKNTKAGIERICEDRGIKLTTKRKIIAKIISESNEHLNVEEIYRKASEIDKSIGISTVYRAIAFFEENNLVNKLSFAGSLAPHYEHVSECKHHDHLIDITTNKIVEFYDEDLEVIKDKVAKKLGYKLVDHTLILYGKPINE